MTTTDQPHEQWRFETADPEQQEILAALLADCGFTGFEQQEGALLAAAPVGAVDETAVKEIASRLGVESSREILQPENWNQRWEAEYEPVVVDGWCTVRAHFHQRNPATLHDIVITPKMSFGTGHHATTWLMLQGMQNLELQGRRVLDFGTGTGVLAILAAKLGAPSVLALDNDAWSVENARENVQLNDFAAQIEVVAGSLEEMGGETFDVILANINRHILLHYMHHMRRLLRPGGTAMLSGLLVEDEDIIGQAALSAGFKPEPARARAGWIALRMR